MLNNVTYCYPNGFKAVENVSMSFEKGESVAIVGQNGAGKTTTVKMMNGLTKPTEGDVIIDGLNTKDYTTAQISRKVGYVFQNPDDQIFHETVKSEIRFGPKNLGFSEEKIEENVMKAAELTGIVQFLDVHPYNLPYSLKKFVTIASVIAMDTDTIILDEPTAGQDSQAIGRLGVIIDALVREGKTIITITHDMEFVVNNFERVIVMANKRVVLDSHKQDVFWNHGVLEEAMLKQPHISRLCHTLNLSDKVLDINQMIDVLKKTSSMVKVTL
ncbi:energy-coupling factor ABC transporter ATP-binding protein [Fictibacillus phosphorivorans]|uniref:energy-coupling factor ABC transporter ATP-binding protein n=1 Tax=Fictibacillus phosphorivorans TaxID=1221500 RepID=UPI002041AC70|nr:ABC transporter ATP-binding protein [Fictibacillus phosphorivorans]MCM3718641.1 energy-coupling factor ABC transporter ATP-binding protein [Fictibacillus phosphorivorans]MCM3776264.1 energy-coupling factor ABC transporter ATP-binding protein [Fictibacillus phosphorivorans]